MADVGSMIAGFVKGATGFQLDQLNERQEAEREIRKMKMLEELRRETAKELALFEEDLPSKKLARQRDEQVIRHADEDQILERDKFGMEKEAFALDTELKMEDQQMQRERLALDRASTAESIANSRASRARYNREEAKAKKEDNILFREFDDLNEHAVKVGANEFELTSLRNQWYNGVNNKGWNKDQQRRFITEMYRTYERKTRLQRARGELPSQRKAEEL